MLYVSLLKGSFQDSVTLMTLSRDFSQFPGINRISIMMGTPANLDVFRETGFWQDDLNAATPNDLCIVVDTDDGDIAAAMPEHVKSRLEELAKTRRSTKFQTVRSWRRARHLAPNANLALISIAGHYAAIPARQALDDGCHVMLFSDNVSIEQEAELKELGRQRGLLVMGPDCGTAIINKAPLAFANHIPEGPIAVIGASGTGIQEVTSQINTLGSGITHAIGLGGRDLSAAIGGISALQAIDFIRRDPASKIVVFVSKPPAAAVRDKVLAALKACGKPVVALFLGERRADLQDGNVRFALTLDGAARLACELATVEAVAASVPAMPGKQIRGLYSGGTLASESALLLAETLDLQTDADHAEGYMLNAGGHQIIDLGDDAYTRGRPHPMIDPTLRNEMIAKLAEQPEVGVMLVDVVIGTGAGPDPAGEIGRAVSAMLQRRDRNQPLAVIATITGTDMDSQGLEAQRAALQDAGILIAASTREAVMLATRLIATESRIDEPAPEFLAAEPSVINIGLRSFAEDLQQCGIPVVQQQWEPVAGGDERLQRLLAKLQ